MIDFRFSQHDELLNPMFNPARLSGWIKIKPALPQQPDIQAAAFAYLSDWWNNFCALRPFFWTLQNDQQIYVTTLNHNLWLYHVFDVNDWLYIACESQWPPMAEGCASHFITAARVN